MSENNSKNNYEMQRKNHELDKVAEWKQKKIQKSYPGYKITEVDLFLDDILNHYETILNELFKLRETYQLLEEQNQQLFNENRTEKEKVVMLSKQIELLKMQKSK